MAAFLIIGTMAGILLGLRFKVLVLIPAMVVATIAVIATAHGARVIALTVILTAVSLQLGYIVGCIARVLARAYLPRQRPVQCPRSEPAR